LGAWPRRHSRCNSIPAIYRIQWPRRRPHSRSIPVKNGETGRLRDYAYNAAIHGGLNAKNTLSVEFRGQHITCKVNGVTVGEYTDPGSSLGAGKVGLEAGDNVNAVFTDFVALP
jgi:hypothetical protein